ncbi:MAG TPA: urease accessory UreF family protein [Pseudonocardia sp.]|nr:urease accessory UreF family protein [Pseudonocardia sp.]
MWAGLMLLADSRLPSGGHIHSGGVESLVDRRLLVGPDDLAEFLAARIRTSGLVVAAVTASACLLASPVDGDRPEWARWNAAVDARTPSSALREVSRAQGTALLRTVTRAWPNHPAVRDLAALPKPHHPLVLGASAAAAGATCEQAGALAIHHLVGGAATASVRLLGLDPLAVSAVQVQLAGLMDEVADRAAEAARRAVGERDPDLLPAEATPLPEILAELHHASEVTLFAS